MPAIGNLDGAGQCLRSCFAVESAVGVLWRAEIAQARMRLSCEAFQERSGNRDLPIPGSPESNTTWPLPVFAFDHRRSSNSSSFPVRQAQSGRSRGKPRSGFRLKPIAALPRLHRPVDTLQVLAPMSSSSKRLPTSFRVLSAMTTRSALQCPASVRQGLASRQRWLAPEKRPSRSDRRQRPALSRCRHAFAGRRGSSDHLPR